MHLTFLDRTHFQTVSSYFPGAAVRVRANKELFKYQNTPMTKEIVSVDYLVPAEREENTCTGGTRAAGRRNCPIIKAVAWQRTINTKVFEARTRGSERAVDVVRGVCGTDAS